MGELWDGSDKSFDKNNLDILYKYLTGNAEGNYDNVASLASSTTTAANIRSKTLSSGSGYSAKSSSQDVIVTLGGLKWEVVYLSNNTDGEPTLTLWLSNSTQDAFSSRSRTEGTYYGYYEGGLYSDWSADWHNVTPGSYPSNMYGTSYIRAVTLNNGGQYATSYSALGGNASKSTSNIFAPFTVDSFGLTNYIVKPTKMSWQRDQSSIKELGQTYTYPNEAIGPSNINWYNSTYDYSIKTNYTAWENDNLWLPSLAETGSSDSKLGMWGLSVNQRKNYDGSTTTSISLSGAVGNSNTRNNSSVITSSWLRSGYYNTSYTVCSLYPSGNTYSRNGIDFSNAVRPALHLNLKKIQESMPVLWEDYASENYASGIGTETSPYIIKTAEQLAKLAKDSRTSDLEGKHYKLGANIDLKEYLWKGISLFDGVLDGNFFNISNMTTTVSDGEGNGLFDYLTGTVKNLILTDSVAFCKTNVGGIAGQAGTKSIIDNCICDNVFISSCDEDSTHSAGGIAGVSYGAISNSIVRNVNIFNENPHFVGGLVGYGNVITNCSVIGTRIKGGYEINVITAKKDITITATFGEVMLLKGTLKGDMTRVLYGNSSAFNSWCYHPSLNGGYPLQTSLLTIGAVSPNSTAVYNKLKALGF